MQRFKGEDVLGPFDVAFCSSFSKFGRSLGVDHKFSKFVGVFRSLGEILSCPGIGLVVVCACKFEFRFRVRVWFFHIRKKFGMFRSISHKKGVFRMQFGMASLVYAKKGINLANAKKSKSTSPTSFIPRDSETNGSSRHLVHDALRRNSLVELRYTQKCHHQSLKPPPSSRP